MKQRFGSVFTLDVGAFGKSACPGEQRAQSGSVQASPLLRNGGKAYVFTLAEEYQPAVVELRQYFQAKWDGGPYRVDEPSVAVVVPERV